MLWSPYEDTHVVETVLSEEDKLNWAITLFVANNSPCKSKGRLQCSTAAEMGTTEEVLKGKTHTQLPEINCGSNCSRVCHPQGEKYLQKLKLRWVFSAKSFEKTKSIDFVMFLVIWSLRGAADRASK